MVGRSHAMPALPTTFGLKVASWIDELIRHLKRLKSMRPRIAVAQLFGGVGTMAGLGPHALDLLADFAPRLGLGIPITCWHASRDRVAEFVHVMAMLSASLARIADELRTLHREEIGEVFMHLSSSYIGSSTMPYKCNPENAEQVVTLSRLARAQVPLALEAMHVEHERDYRSTRLEWCCVADVSHYTLAALALMTKILDSLKVNTARMGERAQDFREQICAEQLVFALAPSLGKDVAYQLVDSYLRKSHEDEVPLIQLLARDARVMHILGGYKGIESSLCANSHLGSNDKLIDNVLQYALENLSSSRSHEDLLS
jgi:adenylosuccinate lyase